MSNNISQNPFSNPSEPPDREVGLRAPPGLSSWGKAWWWFHFLVLVKLARLRFVGILCVIGLVLVKWDLFIAYYQKWTRPAVAAQEASADIEYFCPMHPAIVRDNPREKCPICFMPLSRRKKGETTEEALPPGIVNRLQLSPYRIALAGIQTWKVTYVPLVKEINAVGFVEFNERQLKHIAARVKGRIDQLLVNETGQMVQAGNVLASLYSPDLVVTVQNLLDAHKVGNPTLAAMAKDRLLLWGISDDQLKEILRTGKANTHLNIRAPINGHVLKKYVREGQYVDEGSPLYDIADLSSVWIEAQIYEDDLVFLPYRHGEHMQAALARVHVTAQTQAFAGETFAGRLTFLYPHADQETHTVIARYEMPNPEHKLRPGMTASIQLKVPPAQVPLLLQAGATTALLGDTAELAARLLAAPGGAAPLGSLTGLLQRIHHQALMQLGLVLAVPDSAVIDTGQQQIVYRQVVSGEYEGVRVELGPRMVGPDNATYYPVLRGLEMGDLVVTAGSFLVDAETRLNPAAGSIYFGGSAGSKTAAGGTVKPSTPADEDLKIKTAIARLPAADRPLAEKQMFCPVIEDSRLGSMGVPYKILIHGQPVFLCCKGCERGALKNPRETLNKVAKLKNRP